MRGDNSDLVIKMERLAVKIGALAIVCLALVAGALSCNGNAGRYPPPGGGPFVSFNDHIDIKAGETKTTDITLMIRRPDSPVNVSYGIFKAEKAEDYSPSKGGMPYEKLPMPEGLDISIKPDEFVAYPNRTYNSTILIEASTELDKGEYQLFLEILFDDSRWPGSGWIVVNVD